MLNDNGTWDVQKVYSLFAFEEAEVILSIPLLGDNADKRIWHFTPNGRYTVRSGYRKALDFRNLIVGVNPPPMQVPSSDQLMWKHLWKLKVPPKVLNFLWRMVSDILPTRDQLLRRRLIENSVCFRCENASEPCLHAIVDCAENSNVWRGLDLPEAFCMAQVTDLAGWLKLGWSVLSEQQLRLAAICSWMLWN